jgi:hypothetical protein
MLVFNDTPLFQRRYLACQEFCTFFIKEDTDFVHVFTPHVFLGDLYSYFHVSLSQWTFVLLQRAFVASEPVDIDMRRIRSLTAIGVPWTVCFWINISSLSTDWIGAARLKTFLSKRLINLARGLSLEHVLPSKITVCPRRLAKVVGNLH